MSKYIGKDGKLAGPVMVKEPDFYMPGVLSEWQPNPNLTEQMEAYQQHLSSLPSLPCEGWKPEEGVVYELWVHFVWQYQYKNNTGFWLNCDLETYIKAWRTPRRIVSVPVPPVYNPNDPQQTSPPFPELDHPEEGAAYLQPVPAAPQEEKNIICRYTNLMCNTGYCTGDTCSILEVMKHKDGQPFTINHNHEEGADYLQPVTAASQQSGNMNANYTMLRKCYEKYTSLLAEQLYRFRNLANEIHQWSTEKNLERKIKALDRLELEYYQLSIKPESNEMIIARKNLADALEFSVPAAPQEGAQEIGQTLKEFDTYFDALVNNHFQKDAGNLWTAFTDKWNAFKKSLLQQPAPGYPAEFVRWAAANAKLYKEIWKLPKAGEWFDYTTAELYQEWKRIKEQSK